MATDPDERAMSWARKFSIADKRAGELEARLLEVTEQRDRAIESAAILRLERDDWAIKCGAAQGELEASEWAGVVRGWRERAERAEAALRKIADQDATLTPGWTHWSELARAVLGDPPTTGKDT